jgi:oligopeptide/dipeptide ABC transporter ATP-binding protein
MTTHVLRADDLEVHFATAGQPVRAVDGVNLEVEEGQVVGIVGESGSGKSTLGRALLRLLRPTAGRVLVDGQDITKWSDRRMRSLRPQLQLVFQDPYGSLNPRMTVGATIGYSLLVNRMAGRVGRRQRVEELLERVGLDESYITRLPHQLSGGQRQRVGIARALASRPRFIVADEPVSALDLSTQAQVLNLFRELQQELGLSMLFVTHDLTVAEHLCDRVAVMYAGRIVEDARSAEAFAAPAHPYTGALLAASLLEVGAPVLAGEPPNPRRLPDGCSFHPRCPVAVDRCSVEQPLLHLTDKGDRLAACHLV